MSHFIYNNGQWMPCGDLLNWDSMEEDWEEVAERNGLYDGAYYQAGHPNGFFVEAHATKPNRVFEPNSAVTEVVVVTTNHHLEYYYCTGSLARNDILSKLSPISVSAFVSVELREAMARREAIEIEEVDPAE